LPLAAFKRVPLRNPPSFFVQKNSAFLTRAHLLDRHEQEPGSLLLFVTVWLSSSGSRDMAP
jgi:hypothetical protein